MQLRPYQEDAIKSVTNSMVDGENKQVIVLATGLGKTVIFSHLIDQRLRNSGGKALVLAHREELLFQAQEKIRAINPMLRVNIEQGNLIANEGDSDVIVASVPTLGRTSSDRIMKFDPMKFKTIVIDEAHHSSSDTYINILKHFGVYKGGEREDDFNKECLLLGVTATPSRNDNRGIDQIFDTTSFEFGIIDGIKQGYLSTIKAFRIRTDTDLTQIKRTAGDFNLGELGDAVNNEERNALIIQAYKEHVDGKQAIVFAVDVAHTESLSAAFNAAGVKASFVTGAIPREERRQRLDDFYNFQYQVMVNAMVLTEGYDNPSVQAILMARPTQSGILYQQMVGRGTRLFTGKPALTLIDFVDNTRRQSLKTSSSLVGLDNADVDFKGHDIVAKKDQLDQLLELAPNLDLSTLDVDRIEYAIEEVDVLSGLVLPEELDGLTKNDWHRYSENEYRVGLGDGGSMHVRQTLTGQFQVVYSQFNKDTFETKEMEIGDFANLEVAMFKADRYIIQNKPEAMKLIQNTATWRSADMSPAQRQLLKNKFKVNDIVLNQLSKGQASRLIQKMINYSDRQKVTKG